MTNDDNKQPVFKFDSIRFIKIEQNRLDTKAKRKKCLTKILHKIA